MHGFLGPNGAGKSTTIRALLGLLRVDDGTATVFGQDPWRDAVAIHRRLAYVPGDVALWPNLSGGETVDMLLRMRGADPGAGHREELLERFDLDPTKKGRAYSKGNRQKVALVAAFAADVDLLVLDEPTSGLDPLMEQVFNDCVAERVGRGHHGAALQPHPQRGRAAGRPGHDHPRGQGGRVAGPSTSSGTCAAAGSTPPSSGSRTASTRSPASTTSRSRTTRSPAPSSRRRCPRCSSA